MTISVVIPTYNRGELIRETLDSVLAQTLAPLEILVIDDGSTDGTPEWIEAHYGAPVRVIRQQNGGVARARNRGVREAQGQWIAFLDHDDCFHPEKLAKLAPLATAEVGVIVPRWREVEAGEVVRESPHVLPRNTFDWLFGWHNPIVSMSVPLVRREVLRRVGGFDPRCVPADDWDLWLRLADVTGFAFSDEILVDYTLHAGQQRRDEKRMFRAARRILSKFPLQLARRPLLLWWLLWSGAFVASLPFYEGAKRGGALNNSLLGALRAHPLSLLSPQWLALVAKKILRRGGSD